MAAHDAAGSGGVASGLQSTRGGVVLNFENADIEQVVRTLGAATQRNVVVDPRVQGKLNLRSDRSVSSGEAWRLLTLALRPLGVSIVSEGGVDRVLPEADAKIQSRIVHTQMDALDRNGGQVVTQIFQLQYENANNILPILRPLIGANNVVNISPNTNALVVTDYADNVRRIARIIASLDVPNATNVEVLPLSFALASDLAPLVTRLLESQNPAGADASYKTTIVGDLRSNALIVRAANASRIKAVRNLVDKLDRAPNHPAQGTSDYIHVVSLKHADAAKLAVTLRAILQSVDPYVIGGSAPLIRATASTNNTLPPTPNPVTATSTLNTAGVPSTGGQVQADPATNSLIITASMAQFRQLRAIIDKLDERRPQVYVEALIAEVSTDNAAEWGIQWQAPIGNKGDNNIGVIGTNYRTGGANIIDLTAKGVEKVPALSAGLNIGLATLFNGKYILGALARFLQSNGDANILAAPNLLTLDNEEARIVIGQNVPFVTGQYTNNNSANGAVNPFQTIERKDVGLTLRVKPQVSDDGNIRMQVFQEVSSINATSPAGLITNKRSIESNVIVEDGSIVVLGGLMQDDFANTEDKIPLLGDIPILGNLFKATTRKHKKTNLMVFLRPVVLRDAVRSEQFSIGRFSDMQETMPLLQQQLQQPVKTPGADQAPKPPSTTSSPSELSHGQSNRGRNESANPALPAVVPREGDATVTSVPLSPRTVAPAALDWTAFNSIPAPSIGPAYPLDAEPAPLVIPRLLSATVPPYPSAVATTPRPPFVRR